VSSLTNGLPWINASRLCVEYQSDMILIWVAGNPAFLVTSPKLLGEVLQEKDIKCFYKSVPHLAPMLGPNDPFCANGEEYHSLRKAHPFILPEWRQGWLPLQLPSIRKLVAEHIEKLVVAKQPVDIMWRMQRLMFDTFSASLLGRTLPEEAHDDYHLIGEYGDERIKKPYLNLSKPLAPGYNAVMKKWYDRFDAIINENYANPNPSETSIVQFLQRERPDKKYSADEVGETLHGGVYSVGSAIVSILHCLAQNRSYLEKLEKELKEKLGSGKDYSHEALQNIPFLEAVLRESLRLLPPVSFYARKALTDCVLNGVDVPKDSTIMVSTWNSHHDDKFWKDPFTFNPNRWLESADFLDQNSYGSDYFCPFGRGIRQCMGYPFGLLNMKVAVVAFVLSTDFKTYADTWEDNFFFGINMPYALRAKVQAKPRN